MEAEAGGGLGKPCEELVGEVSIITLSCSPVNSGSIVDSSKSTKERMLDAYVEGDEVDQLEGSGTVVVPLDGKIR